MATPPYVPLNPDVPSGPTQTPPQYSAADLANVRALRDAVVCGFVPGWSYSYNSAGFPIVHHVWANGAFRLRAVMTYLNSAGVNYVQKFKWEWSNDSGATYAAMSTGGTETTITIDGNGAVTAADKDVGWWLMFVIALNAAQYGKGQISSHAAGVGSAVHGLGTMSTQNANAVSISGGTIQSAGLYNIAHLSPSAPQNVNGTTWAWNTTPTHCVMNVGQTVTLSPSSAQSGEMKRLLVYGNGAVTITGAVWAAGSPVWGTVQTMVTLVFDGSRFLASTTPFNV